VETQPKVTQLEIHEIQASSTADESSFVPAKLLWPTRFKSAAECSRFLDSHGTEIRSRKPSKFRRLIHAGDWTIYWNRKDEEKAKAIDDETAQDYIAEIEARKVEERRKKRG
jgi:hypothetical protein